MKPKSLSGESTIKRFTTKSDDGTVADPTEAIVPVIAQDVSSQVFRFIGTAFCITTNGLIVTAKHVLDDVRQDGDVIGPIGVVHFMGNNSYIIRNIKNSYGYPNSDVAVALLDQPRHHITGEPLLNKVLTITMNQSTPGDLIHTYAYPKTRVESNGRKHKFLIAPSVYEGVLVKEFPDGRDATMLPNPCWQTRMHIHGGSSGGPVFNASGHAIGTNCTSLSIDPGCSFISTLAHIQNLKISNISVAGKKEVGFTVRELMSMGLISTADNQASKRTR